MTTILETKGLAKKFGGVVAVGGLDFAVSEGEILGLIGPNGAGKSTVFNMITGFLRPSAGEVIFEGRDVVGKRASAVAKLGMARVFQQSVLFSNISVSENVIVGFHRRRQASLTSSFLGTKRARKEENEFRAGALEILEFLGLLRIKDEMAGSLPHGHQRLLSVGIALATSPRLLLLDEPVTGMIQTEMNDMVRIIRAIRERGITIMLVEHHMQVVREICDRALVLNYGCKIAEGTPIDVCQDPEVCAAYLGKETFGAA